MAAQLERCVGAVEKLHSREQQLGVADVLQVVDHEFAFLEGELLDVAWLVGGVRHPAVAEVRAGAAAGMPNCWARASPLIPASSFAGPPSCAIHCLRALTHAYSSRWRARERCTDCHIIRPGLVLEIAEGVRHHHTPVWAAIV
jgi:hypothetical protein